MLVAVLRSTHGPTERNVEFSQGVLSADGLGEVTPDDLREIDAAGQLNWVSDEMRMLVLGFSLGSCPSRIQEAHLSDSQMQLAIETEVIYVPPHRVGTKSQFELRRIVADMLACGWLLVEDTRLGASGGHLVFKRSEPLDPAVIARVRLAS